MLNKTLHEKNNELIVLAHFFSKIYHKNSIEFIVIIIKVLISFYKCCKSNV